MSYVIVPTYRVACDGCSRSIPELPLDEDEESSSWTDPEAVLRYRGKYKRWSTTNPSGDAQSQPGALHLCGTCSWKLLDLSEMIGCAGWHAQGGEG